MLRTKKNAARGLCVAIALSVFAGAELRAIPVDLGDACAYTLLQLGNPLGISGGVDGELSVDSKSLVNGNVGKANDGQGKELKVSSSTINGKTDRATGVNLSVSSSTITGGNFANVNFSSVVSDAVAASVAAAALPGGISDTVNLNGGFKLFTGNGGTNVINVSGNFSLNSGAELRLSGGLNDYFVFNIAAGNGFDVNGSDIVLLGGLDPSQVLFNVLGTVAGNGPDDVKIQQSLFRGTLLTPGLNVLINDNHQSVGNGLFGAIIAGGKLLFAESDITHDPFCAPTTVPEGGMTLLLLGASLAGVESLRRRFFKP